MLGHGFRPPCGLARLSPLAHSNWSAPVKQQCLSPLAYGSVHYLCALVACAVRVRYLCVVHVACAMPLRSACALCLCIVRSACTLCLCVVRVAYTLCTLPASFACALCLCVVRTPPARCVRCLRTLPACCTCCLQRHTLHPTGSRLSHCQPSVSLQVPMGAGPTHGTMFHSVMFGRG